MKMLRYLTLVLVALLFVQCSDNDEVKEPIADFQFLVEGAQVTFNGTVINTDTILWDFGDGNTSDVEDPVHAYERAGDYTVSMTAMGPKGEFTEIKQVTILPSLEILLTGGPAKPEGKSWKLKRAYTAGIEGAGFVADNLEIFLGSQENLLDLVGLGASYDDSFTFVHDGQYKVNNANGQSMMGLVFAMIEHAADIREVSWDPQNVPLANAVYTPKTDATWEIVEGDFTVNSAMGPVEFYDKTRLVMDEYFGFKEKNYLVILKDIDENNMNVAISIATVPEAYQYPTLLFHLSFEAP